MSNQPLARGRVLRRLAACDAPALFEFFELLGPASKRRSQPHPLTSTSTRK
jgi:hypothetical protein